MNIVGYDWYDRQDSTSKQRSTWVATILDNAEENIVDYKFHPKPVLCCYQLFKI